MLEKIKPHGEKLYRTCGFPLQTSSPCRQSTVCRKEMREYKRMTPIIETYHAYLNAMQQQDENKKNCCKKTMAMQN